MIIYFCDRQLNILGQASTTLPAGNRISQDKLVEDVETGVNSFECFITWDENTRHELESAIVAGNYILKQSDTAYDSLYQIIETEADTKAQEIYLYAEDAGLDLLNTLCPAVTLENKNITQMLSYFLPADWTINIQDAPTTTKTNEWDGESTCTERIRSVVGLWDCELYYSFRIEQLQVKEKFVNVVVKRGLQEAIPQLRLNYDIDRIVTKTSITDLVTALNVTGGTPEGSETPINLINYNYSYTDPVTGDVYQVHKPTGQMRNISAMDRWSSVIDQDGLWVGSYQYDTTDIATLAGQARAELQRLSVPAVNYEVDFARLPEDAQIGDRVNIIDDEGELYLEARLLQIETCEAEQTKVATIGEYLLRTAGIAEKVAQIAEQVRQQSESDQRIREEVQILAETVGTMLTLEVESNIVAGHAQLKAHLYNGDKEVTTEHSEALYKWILRKDTGETLLGRGYTLNVNLEVMGYAGTILCRFIRPELYDLTDHNLIPITDQDGNIIQVSYAGVYAQPVVRRASKLKALNKASNTNNVLRATANETGYPVLAREVNLYERGNLDKDLKGTLQYFWNEQEGAFAGAHITEVTKEEFLADPANAGGNLLAQSDGISVRYGMSDLATFKSSGATIGKENANVFIDANGTVITNNSLLSGYRSKVEFESRGIRFRQTMPEFYENGNGWIAFGGAGYADTEATYNGTSFRMSNTTPLNKNEIDMADLSAGDQHAATVGAYCRMKANGTRVATIYFEADEVLSDVAITVVSDKRLKNHIRYLGEDAAEFCRNLQPAVFIKNDETHLGFYAQDVQTSDKWGARLTVSNNEGYLGLNYTELIAPLVAYCQSLEKRIKELEDKNG